MSAPCVVIARCRRRCGNLVLLRAERARDCVPPDRQASLPSMVAMTRRSEAMVDRSEKAKMLASELYNATGPELTGERRAAQRLLALYNATDADDQAGRLKLMRQLFGAVGDNPDILPRFHCDYGYNIRVGCNCFVNYNCVFLDCAAIEIGD